MRGFGVTSVSFATETHMSRIADVLGIDPFEIRLKNANRIGDTSPNGVVYTDPVDRLDDPQAIADAIGHELAGRLPDDDERAPRRRAAARAPRRPGRKPGGSLAMAKHTGRGIAAIEYPTGMNQNGDPSQAWIKVKPDGRIDVFAGTADIGNGSKTIQTQIVAETIGVPYDWVTYDNSNTDSSPMCTGTFASRATFVAGKAALKAAQQVKQKLLEIAGKELEIDPADLEIVDGEVIAKGAPQTKISVSRRRRRGDLRPRRADHRHGRPAQAVRGDHRLGDGEGRPPAPLRDLVRDLRGRGRGRRRDGRGARARGCRSATTSAVRSTRRWSRARSRAAP